MNKLPATIEIHAPAKVNLGLEVHGRRPDGYHEISTIFCTIDSCDTLLLHAHAEPGLHCKTPGVAEHDNLILEALRELRSYCQVEHGLSIDVVKRIPIAAGLGGASSNAAAALIAANELWGTGLELAELKILAGQVGSDVPFFLSGGAAYGTGRGDTLYSLKFPMETRFVLVSPSIEIQGKTPGLYADLQAPDFSDGDRVRTQAHRLIAGSSLDPELLGNAFTRPLYDRLPHLAALPALMHDSGASIVALSGAGPTHYAVVESDSMARRIARELRRRLGTSARVFVAAPIPARYHG